MIVDFHTHYVGRAYAHLGGGSIVDSMDRYGVDHSVIFTLDGFFEADLGAVGIHPFDPPGPDVLRFNTESEKQGRPYLRIGTDLDGNPILVQPMEDTVYVLRRAASDPKRQYLASFPSIYHWLLIEHPDYNA